ncbi:hypothetical protein MTO96_011782 [Rhipicephalus appendiculatus]
MIATRENPHMAQLRAARPRNLRPKRFPGYLRAYHGPRSFEACSVTVHRSLATLRSGTVAASRSHAAGQGAAANACAQWRRSSTRRTLKAAAHLGGRAPRAVHGDDIDHRPFFTSSKLHLRCAAARNDENKRGRGGTGPRNQVVRSAAKWSGRASRSLGLLADERGHAIRPGAMMKRRPAVDPPRDA